MPRYLLKLSDQSARILEGLLGGRLEIGNQDILVPVAGLDAVTDEEIEPIQARLRSGGPLYHAGGPGGAGR